jgi:hypothetical protein
VRRRLEFGPDLPRLDATALADLGANVFAALLLVLLILIAASARDAAAPVTAAVEAADLGARPRRPLRPAELVDALYARRPGAEGLDVDLLDAGPRLPSPAPGPGGLAEALAALPPGAPVRVFVFSHRAYEATARALERSGRSWEELSVPRALRAATGDGWSPAFLALIDRARTRETFRDGLARLLAEAPGPITPGPVAPGPAASGGSAAAAGSAALLERLSRWLAAFLAVAAPMAGLGAVLAVERLVPRRRPEYGSAHEAAAFAAPPSRRA